MEIGGDAPSQRAAGIVLDLAAGRPVARPTHPRTDSLPRPRVSSEASIRAAITGVHGYVPEDVLDNATLARTLDTSDEWISERTGIKERRILKGEGSGPRTWRPPRCADCWPRPAHPRKDVDLLICATTTPDLVFPSTANIVCDMVGIRNIGSFDVQAACSGFLYALTVATQFIGTGKCRKIVVVGADKMSSIIDYTDRATCVLFGDGAGPCCSSRARTATASKTP